MLEQTTQNNGVVETPVTAEATTEAVTTEASSVDSARFAAIAKKEQRAVHRELELKKKELELQAKEKELTAKLTPFQEFELQRAKDPVAALRGLGFSETDIFNWLAQSEKKELTPEEKAEAAAQKKIDEFKKEQADKETQTKTRAEQETIARFKTRLKGFLEVNKEKYEHCAYQGVIAETEAYFLTEQIAKDTGKLPSIDEVYTALEQFYDDEHQARLKLKKYQPKVEPEVIQQPKKDEPVPRGTKTITNAATATIASTVKRVETREQKRERLINQIRQAGLHK